MIDDALATKTLFFLAGYALPFLTDAMRDTDPFIRAQAVLTYPYAAGAIAQFDAYLEALDALGPRPQWALTLEKDHNKDQTDWRMFAGRALSDPAPGVRIAGIQVLTKSIGLKANDVSLQPVSDIPKTIRNRHLTKTPKQRISTSSRQSRPSQKMQMPACELRCKNI